MLATLAQANLFLDRHIIINIIAHWSRSQMLLDKVADFDVKSQETSLRDSPQARKGGLGITTVQMAQCIAICFAPIDMHVIGSILFIHIWQRVRRILVQHALLVTPGPYAEAALFDGFIVEDLFHLTPRHTPVPAVADVARELGPSQVKFDLRLLKTNRRWLTPISRDSSQTPFNRRQWLAMAVTSRPHAWSVSSLSSSSCAGLTSSKPIKTFSPSFVSFCWSVDGVDGGCGG